MKKLHYDAKYTVNGDVIIILRITVYTTYTSEFRPLHLMS